jgi:hypothetical protein
MKQSRLESMLEATINVASGFVIAMLVMEFVVVPLWGLPWTIGDNFIVTCIFTSVSVVRGYFWRRFFNAGVHRMVHRVVQGWWVVNR